MTRLTVADVADRHPYLAQRFDDHRDLGSILVPGHPWPCSCGADSLLCYRCSACGRDLTSD